MCFVMHSDLDDDVHECENCGTEATPHSGLESGGSSEAGASGNSDASQESDQPGARSEKASQGLARILSQDDSES